MKPNSAIPLRRKFTTGAVTLAAWSAGLITVFPIAWMVLSSFKNEADAYTKPPTFIFTPTLRQYINLFDGGVMGYFANSVFATLVALAVVLILGLPAAYALTIRRVPRWRASLSLFLLTRYLPAAAIIVPLYLLARDLLLLDNIWTISVLYIGMNMALAVWMLQSFMNEIPREIIEAAHLDGANVAQVFIRVIIPLMRPGIAATAIICAIFSWNEFFFAVNLTSSSSAATLPVYLVSFLASEGPFWAQVSAAATFSALPILLLGWFAQKSLIRGLTMGAVK